MNERIEKAEKLTDHIDYYFQRRSHKMYYSLVQGCRLSSMLEENSKAYLDLKLSRVSFSVTPPPLRVMSALQNNENYNELSLICFLNG